MQNELDSWWQSLPQIAEVAIKMQNNSGLWISKSPYQTKCQKVIAWSGNFGMDLYISWNIPKEDLTLDMIWNKFEELSKPQINEVRAHFDLLTSFHQGSRNVDKWYNAIHAQVNLAKYPPEMAKILHRDIFWFFMWDEDFVKKTINEGNINIQKFPASKVCQLAKKMESSKATAKHIRQVTGDIPAAQVQLMHYQRTQLPARNYPRRKLHVTRSQKLQNCKTQEVPMIQKTPLMLQPDASSDKCNRCSNTSHAKGFQCPTRKFQCKICHKFGHFTSVCYQKDPDHHPSSLTQSRKPKAQQLCAGALYTLHDAESSAYESGPEDTFCLQMKVHRTHISHPDVPKLVYLMANLAYCLQEHHTRNQYLWARLDTCTNVNLMPMAVYCLMFKDPQLKKLTPSNMEIETYTTEVVKIIGMCHFYLVHPESKQLSKVMFFVAKENGSVLLSCRTTIKLGLIKPRAHLDYLPPKARLLTSTCDQPSKTKSYKPVIHYMKETVTPNTSVVPSNDKTSTSSLKHNITQKDDQLVTRQEHIMAQFPDAFEGVGKFPGKPYKICLDPKIPPKQTPCRPVPVHLKHAFKAEIDKMLKAGVLKPVQEATPWINSFVLVEGTDQHGQHKLWICLDPTNLNKAVVQEPYHFKTPEDIAHLLVDATVLTVLGCKKGYWHQQLDEESSYLMTFNTEFGRYHYNSNAVWATVTGNAFQWKLDQCFGCLENVIVIANDIMVVGKQSNHRDHNIALTQLLKTARECIVHLNYDKLQYKQTKVDFFSETYTIDGRKPLQSKVKAIQEMPPPQLKNKCNLL